MDLIYTNARKEDQGVVPDFKLDLSFGYDENNFELSVSNTDHICEDGSVIYMEGTEYGGIVDAIRVETENRKIVYLGNTWHGLLESKVIEPLKQGESTEYQTIRSCGKNLLENTATSQTVNGVTFTVNEDGSVTLNGTATDVINIEISKHLKANDLKDNVDYVLSGGSTNAKIFMNLRDSSDKYIKTITQESGSGFAFNKELLLSVDGCVFYNLGIYVPNGSTHTNTIVNPMIRLASDTDSTYKPYHSYENEYLVVSGDANLILGDLIGRMGLSDLFQASNELSGLTISNYSMHRYVKGYTGIKKMLATVNGKLKFTFAEGYVILSAEPLVDYSRDDEFDSDQIDFVIEKKFKPTNHMICLGKGELKDRTVIHLYTDAEGNISHTQSLFGLDERTDIYDNANVESEEELEQGGIEALQASWNEDKLQLDLDASSSYDIGDIVGARELVTGITTAKPIIQKIVTIEKDVIKITHKVGE